MNIVNRTVLNQLTKILGSKSSVNSNCKTLANIIGNFYKSQLIFPVTQRKYLFATSKNQPL